MSTPGDEHFLILGSGTKDEMFRKGPEKKVKGGPCITSRRSAKGLKALAQPWFDVGMRFKPA
jgi:hypothetical protein